MYTVTCKCILIRAQTHRTDFSTASSNTTVPRQLLQSELNRGSSFHSSFAFNKVKGLRCGHHVSILNCSMKQTKKNPIFLSVMWFNVSVSIRFMIVDVLLESRHSQTQRLHHRTRALCVCVCSQRISW